MKKVLSVVFSFYLLCMLSGCFKTTVSFDPGVAPIPSGKATRLYIFGLISTQPEIDVEMLCPKGTAAVEQVKSTTDFFIDFFTAGIVSRRTITIYCK